MALTTVSGGAALDPDWAREAAPAGAFLVFAGFADWLLTHLP
jgi:hypothetical protein